MFTRFVPLVVFIIAGSINLYAQQPVFRQFSEKEGLPSSEVYHVIQDSKGFIWFATDNGVSKYNGTEFENYGLEDGLPDLTVFEIYEDFLGRIWFIPLSGQLSYFSNGRISLYKFNHILQSFEIQNGPIKYGFHVDRDETVYLSFSPAGIVQINNEGETNILRNDDELEVNTFHKICDSVIMNSRMNTCAYVGGSLINISWLQHKIPFREKYGEGKYSVQKTIVKKNNGFLYFAAFSYFFQFASVNDLREWRFDEQVVGIDFDRYGGVWAGTINDGVYYFEDGDVRKGPSLNLFHNTTVSSTLVDKEGSCWMTTLNNGVFYIPNLNVKVYNENGFGEKKIRYITVHDGLIIFAEKNDTLYYSLQKDGTVKTGNTIAPINAFKSDNSSLFLGTKLHLAELKKELKSYASSGSVLSVFIKDAKVYCGLNIGLSVLHKDRKLDYRSISEHNFKERVDDLVVVGDSIYMGCPSGLVLKGDNGYTNLGKENELLSHRIVNLDYDSVKHTVYAGSKGAGVIIYAQDTIFRIGEPEGLTSNFVTGVNYENNKLWVSTNKGLNIIEFEEPTYVFRIRTITTKQGLSSNIINEMDVKNDVVYLATDEGVCWFNSNDIPLNEVSPIVYIKNVLVNYKDTALNDFYRLNYKQNTIAISYRGLTYRSVGDINYRYKLNNNWIYTDNNEVQFNALKSGKYNFQVQAANEDGVWSDKSATVNFIILPPFWKTWWFISLALVFISVLVFIIVRARFEAQEERNALNNELIKIRQQALGAQMNPHFIFNSLNSIQNYILKNDRLTSQKYLSSFAKLMRKVLSNSQNHSIGLDEELSALKLYVELEKIRFSNRFILEFDIDGSINTKMVRIPPLILQPFVENAIWHGLMPKENDARLSIKVKPFNEGVICIIEDNGIGREKSRELNKEKHKTYKSLGMSITDRRINLFNMLYKTNLRISYVDLKSNDGNALGTRIIIELP